MLGLCRAWQGVSVPGQCARRADGWNERLMVASLRHQLPTHLVDVHGLACGRGRMPGHLRLHVHALRLPHDPQGRGSHRGIDPLDARRTALRTGPEARRGLAVHLLYLRPPSVHGPLPQLAYPAGCPRCGRHSCHRSRRWLQLEVRSRRKAELHVLSQHWVGFCTHVGRRPPQCRHRWNVQHLDWLQGRLHRRLVPGLRALGRHRRALRALRGRGARPDDERPAQLPGLGVVAPHLRGLPHRDGVDPRCVSARCRRSLLPHGSLRFWLRVRLVLPAAHGRWLAVAIRPPVCCALRLRLLRGPRGRWRGPAVRAPLLPAL
mmetsp:Transcript_46220/g.148400  ORF Transcript_46220/g.148400 Transcript_46220/m.148400 type:complete len:319 (-) Transcript_46220:1080-2036(-)